MAWGAGQWDGNGGKIDRYLGGRISNTRGMTDCTLSDMVPLLRRGAVKENV